MTGKHGQLVRSLLETPSAREAVEWLVTGRPEVDLQCPGSLARAIRDQAPDLVINAAAFTVVDQAEEDEAATMRVNADAAGEAASAARDHAIPIIQVSTDYVFDGRAAAAYREDMATSPLGVYGRSKLAGEEQVRAANPDHLIVRTAWLYSPFGNNFVKTIMRAAGQRDVLTVVDDQLGSPTSTLDLAAGLMSAINGLAKGNRTGLGETYHLAGSGRTTWCGLATEVMANCRRLGLDHVDVLPIATADWPTRAPRPHNSELDSGKFADAFGFTMPDWRHSVRNVVERLAADR
ncbi:dTDP-4-dehydrorhamnose reductase [Sphingomonas sp.]|uniref:dTDP-4-dehydrorhamnose reductase n=1 Tax=Sphingomonas sp. TaxID=28214 RepID=UPI0025FEC1EF|nr:dTDP-4-dehydrorhamnose reductase [Sphingomonas sp.]